MPSVSSEQVQAAKTVDLLTYLQTCEPHELKKSSANEYRTASHGSLVISNGLWFWHKAQIGGRTALDYLIKVRGMGFVESVETVLGSRAAPVLSALPVKSAKSAVQTAGFSGREAPGQPQKSFTLPPRARFPSHMLAYLQERGICPDVIQRCMSKGLLYESLYKGKNVCVFVGRDERGTERFACMRGIYSDLKQDVSGSDKRYSFSMAAENPGSTALAVFEAPIDALSHAALAWRGDLAFDGHRLSLGGTADVALMSFLERGAERDGGASPQIERVSLCLDNDEAGRAAVQRIRTALSGDERFAHIAVTVDPPEHGKDYNDSLLYAVRPDKEQSQHSRKRNDEYLIS